MSKAISFKECEPQEAKMKCFHKKKVSFLCITCAYLMNEVPTEVWPFPCNAWCI